MIEIYPFMTLNQLNVSSFPNADVALEKKLPCKLGKTKLTLKLVAFKFKRHINQFIFYRVR